MLPQLNLQKLTKAHQLLKRIGDQGNDNVDELQFHPNKSNKKKVNKIKGNRLFDPFRKTINSS